MSYDSKTERLISIKKLGGKAHTSNDKGLSNEALPSGVTVTSETVFGESITGSPSNSSLYTITGKVEYVRFPATFLAGSDTASGRHGFELKLPSDYESNSSNPKAGTYPFQNGQSIQITSGSLQLVPTSFGTSYEAKPYYGGNATKDSGTQIPVLDARDWYMDYFNGVFFQQDPPGTGDHANNPDFIEAYLYIGNFLSTVVASVDTDTTYTAGDGLDLSGTEFGLDLKSGSGLIVTSTELDIDDAVIATLSGSVFSGHVGVTGSIHSTAEVSGSILRGLALSGSLTHLEDGSSYIIAGTNIQVATGSSGALTISSTDTNTQLTQEQVEDFAGSMIGTGGTKTGITVTYQDGTGDMDFVVSDLNVAGDSGSTGMTPGDTLTIAGGTNITTAMSGDTLTITATDTNTTYTAGNGLDLSGTEFSLDLKSGSGLVIDSTELSIDNSVLATLSGSVFSGHVGVTGSIHSTAELSGSIVKAPALSGSLTHLEDGSSYLVAGSNVTITTGSTGAVTISAAGDIDGSGAANRIATWSDSNTLSSDSDFTWNGSLFNVQGDTNLNGTVVINQSGANKSLRVESDNKSNAFEVNGGLDMVLIHSGDLSDPSGYGSSASDPDPKSFADTNFYVSGSINSRGSTTKGTSVFGGDTVVSGTLDVLTGISGSLTKLSDGSSYLIAGSNITVVTGSSGAVTISAAADPDVFKTISVAGQDNLVADASTDTLTLAAGSNVTITTDAASDTLTIASTDTNTQLTQEQVEDFAGGLVASGGTKTGISVTYDDANGDMDFVVSDLNVAGDSGSTGMTPGDTLTVAGGTNVTTAMSGDTLTITSTNTTYTAGDGLDLSGTEFAVDLKSGSGLTITSTELDIDNAIIATLSGSVFSGHVGVTGSIHSTTTVSGSILRAPVLSGSLTRLEDGSSYLIAGSNVQIATGSSGAVTVSSTDTNTQLTQEQVEDFAGSLVASGGTKTGIAITYDDANGDMDFVVSDLNVAGDSGSTGMTPGDTLTIAGGTNVTTSMSGDTLTITSTDTNTTYTAGNGLDLGGTEFSLDLKSGSGLVIDSTELSIDNSVLATLSGSVFSGHVGVTGSIHSTAGISGSIIKAPALSGSLTHLEDGSSYLVAGSNIQIATGSSGAVTISSSAAQNVFKTISVAGQDNVVADASTDTLTLAAGSNVVITTDAASDTVTIASTDTNTTYTAGDGLDLSGTTFSTDLKSAGGLKIDSTELMVDNSIVATLTGSEFSGNVGVGGTLKVAGDVTFNDAGADKDFRVESSGKSGMLFVDGGNNSVGIGTTTPGAQPDEKDDLVIGDHTGNRGMTIASANTGISTIRFARTTNANDGEGWMDYSGNTNKMRFGTNGLNTRMTIAGDGKVGIGTGSPSTELDVAGTIKGSALSGSLTRLSDGSSYLVAGSNIAIATGSSGAVTITSTDTNTTYVSSDFNHDDLTGFVANEHIDWTQASAGTIHSSNYTDTNTTYTAGNGLGLSGTEFSVDPSAVAMRSGTTFTGDVIISGTLTAIETKTLLVSSSILYKSGSTKFGDSADDRHHFTGSAHFINGISGSLTHLEDGSSYLVAGSNVQIATGSSGAVTISASSGGSITAQQAGGSSFNNSATLIFSSSTVADNGGGSITVTPVIGPADDGDYSTGLFSSFNYNTLIGTAIDKFNEVLRSLAPDPAPNLDDMDCNNSSGTTAFLSFGASNDQSSASPAYASSNTAAGFSAINVNGSYAAATSGNNIKKGIYDGTETITGDLNEDVAIHQHNTGVTNYVANAFGNADEGTLKLYVNGALKHSIVLTGSLAGAGVPGSGTAQQLNANSSGFTHLSQTGSAVQSNNVEFTPFKHRTGRFKVHPDDQRNGWNYAQVVHTIASGDLTTNYVEWVNDPDSNALSAAGNAITDVALTGEIAISGIRYATDATANYKVRVLNAYKYVYDNTAITFTVSNCSISSQAKPTINTGAGETHEKVLHLTGAMDISLSGQFGGSTSAAVNVTHPMKSNLSSGGSASASGFLIWNVSNNSTDQFESFRMENKRLTSGSYNAMSDVTGGSYSWDNTLHLSGAADQTDGLIFYNDRLYSAINTLNSGDFRNSADGGSLANGYLSNPNYAGLNSGIKTFFRAFKNETGSPARDFDLTINGSGTTIVNADTALNSGRIRVFGKIPGTTGWMDLAKAFTYNSSSNGDGAYIGAFDSSLSAVNYFSFGTTAVADDDYVMLKIEADAGWTGYSTDITVNFPAVAINAVSQAPVLGNVDCNDSGTAAKLSFGSSKSITGYTNSNTSAGFSAVNINGNYTQTSSSGNLRRAIFDGSVTIDGELNESTGGSGNSYPNNAFRQGHTGSLKLEVNGSVIHTLDIHDLGNLGVGVTTSLNGNSSGFHNITKALNGKDGSSLPDFRYWYRTASYKVHPSDQRNGWNYARVIHSIDGESDRETNYVEWVNDPDSNALSTANPVFSTFGSNNVYYQSGVKYFNSPTGSLAFQVNNCYRNVYSNSSSAISMGSLSNFTVTRLDVTGSGVTNSGANASSMALPALDTSATDPHLLPLHVTASVTFNQSTSLPNSSVAGGTSHNGVAASTIIHPMKSNGTLGSQTKSNFLVFSGSNSSNLNTLEQFVQERYRVQSGSYANQASSFGTMWNSSISMNDQAGNASHASGLLIYNSKLISPIKGPSGGDFRDFSEGGSMTSAPGNPNYSSLTNAVRYYTRHFKNNTTNDTPQITVSIRGSATLVAGRGANYGALGANNNVRVEIKIPGKTGWLDTARASAGSGNVSDGDGGLSGDVDQTIDGSGNSNICTFNGETVNGTVSGAEYIMVSIVAHEDWTGYISRITISYS